jgi:hypothetical protein
VYERKLFDEVYVYIQEGENIRTQQEAEDEDLQNLHSASEV